MHFTLFSIIFSLFVLTTFVHSAPTSSLDSTSATLLNNALEAQNLNAQFANNTATGPCTDGDTECVQGAIASCVNGQFDTSQGNCPATEQCFALPSVTSGGIIIACTSEENALSLIEAAGATGGITGSDSGGSTSSSSASSTLSVGTATSTDSIAPTSTALDESIATVTVTVIASGTTTLPLASVTQTLSPDQASSLLSSLLAQDNPATTATPGGSNEPSVTLSSTVTATVTATDSSPTATDSNGVPSEVTVTATVTATDSNIPSPTATPDSNDVASEVLSSTAPTSATNITSSASPSATPVDVDNTTGSPTSLGSANGGYSS